MNILEDIIKYFANDIKNIIVNEFNKNRNLYNEVQEVRLRTNNPVILKLRERDIVLNYYNVTQSDILQILEKICENSIYAYKNQICDGFITIKGGHRIGIAGTAVVENGQIINIKYITSLNIRIARQVLDCSNKILKDIIDINNQTIFNTLIVSPPGKGKTTILRDVIRKLSNGIEEINFSGKTCGVVDERGEIAAVYRGVPQNDVGIRTDIIDNVSKVKGMRMLVRSMAPEIIACDEIGSKEDIQAIKDIMTAGVKGIFTMHGRDMIDIKNNVDVSELVESKIIEKVIFI